MIEYPSMVQIETTSKCNASCIYCIHKDKKRLKEHMSQEVFFKTVKDCKEAKIGTICPFLNGEFLMDPLIFDRLKYINSELPTTKLDIFSNMSLMNKENLEKLSKIKNINHFFMSCTSYDEKSCKYYQGLDWNKVYPNVLRLIDLNKSESFIKTLSILSLDYGAAENEKLNKMWKNTKGIDQYFIAQKQNWLGDRDSIIPINNDKICPRTHHINVLSNGTVALCCWDYEGQYSIGDIKKNTILEIYNTEHYRKFRTIKKKHLNPCKFCTE